MAKKEFRVMVEKCLLFHIESINCSHLERIKGEIDQALPISKWQLGYVTGTGCQR